FGMGMFPYDKNGYGHNGRIEEFYSTLQYFPDKKMAFSFITNGILYPRQDLVDGALKICFNDSYSIPFSENTATNFENLPGVYSSSDLPFKVTCKKEGNTLIVDAAGRSMTTVPVNPNYFMNWKDGYFFEFNPEKGTLLVKETDNTYYFKKE